MSLENGILGFLSVKPMPCYDIKKLLDISAGYFWHADQTQLYRTLSRLTKDGLVNLKECAKGETFDRKVYEIKDIGQKEYLQSAAENSGDDFIYRDKFLLQLFFSGALSN